MKKTYAFLMALFFCVAAAAQGLLPEFQQKTTPFGIACSLKQVARS